MTSNPGLNIFEREGEALEVLQGIDEEIPLEGVMSDKGPWVFTVPKSDSYYVDMGRIKLKVKAKLTLANGGDLPADADVAPINNVLHSMFKQIDISVASKTLTPRTPTYPFRAYLTNLLTFDENAKSTWLEREGWSTKDTAGHMSDRVANAGYLERKARWAKSEVVELSGNLHVDLFEQEHYMIPYMEMLVRLNKNDDAFTLMAAAEGEAYKLQIVEIKMFVRKLTINPTIAESHIRGLSHGTAKYDLRRLPISMYQVKEGLLCADRKDVFLGNTPRKALVMFLSQEAFAGRYDLNPFDFKHYDVSKLGFEVNGEYFPTRYFEPDFEKGFYLDCYEALYETMGKLGANEGIGLKRTDFARGYGIFAVDFSPDRGDTAQKSHIAQGATNLVVSFKRPLPDSIYVIVVGELDGLLEVDGNRHVRFDYFP